MANRPADGAPSPHERLSQLVDFAKDVGSRKAMASIADLEAVLSSLRAVERERDQATVLLDRLATTDEVHEVSAYWAAKREALEWLQARALSPGAATTESEP